MYVGKPHVGTDVLKGVVKNIREEIKSLGGRYVLIQNLKEL